MYCPSCGVENADGLRYCKRCGGNLSSSAGAPAQRKFPLAMTVAFLALMGFVLSIGLVAPFAVVSETTGRGVPIDSLMPILILIPCVAFGVIGLLVWLLLHLIKIHQQSGSATRVNEARKDSMRDYAPARIAAPPESIGSVTEHTTRNFDSIENRGGTRESVKDTH
jgi:hypothetical protein